MLPLVILLGLLGACGGNGEGDPEAASPGPSGMPSGTGPPGLPAPRQVPPPPGVARLADDRVARLVATAAADPLVTVAVREGSVSEITVEARGAETPGAGGGVVAFLFQEPVTPRIVPWDVLCDIAGQTDEWRGVAAAVGPAADVESSPIWMTGANCVGWQAED